MSRAGMVPVARPDQLFRKSSDINHEQILGRENRSEEEEETMLELFGPDDESSAPARSSTKKKQPQNKIKSRRRGRVLYPEDDQFNKFMKHLMEKEREQNRPENKEMEEALRSTKLMSAFKEAKEAMGCPVKAAYQCPSFVRFLDKAEKRELKRYAAEQDAEDSEESEKEED